MGILDMFARRRGRDVAATRLYLDTVAQARQPAFYLDYGVPDTTEARFALVSLHVHLVCRRLSRESAETGGALAQTLFDTMFADIDRNLREDGEDALADTLAAIHGEDVEVASDRKARLAAYVRAAIAGLSAQDTSDLLDGRTAFPDPAAIG